MKTLSLLKKNGLREFTKYVHWIRTFQDVAGNYDIVHCHFGRTANKFLIIRDAINSKQPLVTTIYGQDAGKYVQLKGPLIYDSLKKHSNMLLTMTNEMSNFFVNLGFPSDKVATHYTGVRSNVYPVSVKQFREGDVFNIVFVGRFVEKKGIPDLLQAFVEVCKVKENVKLHIFGEGTESSINAEIKSIIAINALEDKIVFYGLTAHDEVIASFTRMHVIVQPSKRAANGDTDDLPFVLLEAQACGLPVISTLHVGIPDGVKDGITGYLVPEGDIQALAQKIVFLIDNPSVMTEMSQAARQFIVEKFDLRILSSNLVKLYSNLISSNIYEK